MSDMRDAQRHITFQLICVMADQNAADMKFIWQINQFDEVHTCDDDVGMFTHFECCEMTLELFSFSGEFWVNGEVRRNLMKIKLESKSVFEIIVFLINFQLVNFNGHLNFKIQKGSQAHSTL